MTLSCAVRETLLLVTLSAAVGLAYNARSEKSLPWIAVEKTYDSADISGLLQDPGGEKPQAAPPEAGEPKEIHLDQAWQLFQSGKAVFVDARPENEYAERHIAGALNIPFETWENHAGEFGKLEGRPIITYCSGRDCKASVHLAERLEEMGFTPIFIFFGGWPEWEKAAYPMEP